MNAQAISQKPSLNFERFITYVLNWSLIAVSNVAVFAAISSMMNINFTNDLVGNPLYGEVSTIWIFAMSIFALVQFIMICNILLDFNYRNSFDNFFLESIFDHRVWVFSITSALFAFVAWIGLTYYSSENTMLGTTSGYVRVMENGEVLHSGVTVSHDPALVGSVPIGLIHNMRTNYVVKNGTGYAKFMTVAVKINLDGDSEVFKTILGRQDRDSLGLGKKYLSRTSSQRALFTKIMTPLLEPAVTQIFQEIAAGKLQGGNDIVMLRLGDVFNEMKRDSVVIVPSWINTINVTKVEVTGWQQS